MDDAAVIATFLGKYAQDRAAGRALPLRGYQALFPGHEDLIAAEFDTIERGDASPSPADPGNDDHAGIVAERYRIVRRVARGGQGEVYLAVDERLHRKVALKLIRGLGTLSSEAMGRFRREAEVASRLDHPCLCTVYDSGVERGVAYIAMHYVEGSSLAEVVRERSASTLPSEAFVCSNPSGSPPNPETPPPTTSHGPASVAEMMGLTHLIEKVARALHAAHEAGILHRDIKPSNIMVTPQGEPVILDFGLASDLTSEAEALTRTGDLFGTPAYMSPEQIAGQRVRLDRRSDVYSLGVTLYECLTHRRPFDAPTRDSLYQAILSKSPPDPKRLNRSIPADLKAILDVVLEKDRDRRYQSAEAFADDLRALRERRPIAAKPIGQVGRITRWARREPAKAALLSVLIVALPVIAALLTHHVANRENVERARLHVLEEQKDALLADAFLRLGERDPEAIGIFERARALEGGCPEAAAGIVLAHLRAKEPAKAEAALDAIGDDLDGRPALSMLRAETLRTLGKQNEADEIEAAAAEPRDSLDYFLLGLRLCATPRMRGVDAAAYAKGLHAFTMAILLSPSPRELYYGWRANAAGLAKNREATDESIAALRTLWPRSPAALHSIALGYSLTDRLDEAISTAREGLAIDPARIDLRVLIANCLDTKGALDEAIPELRMIVRLAPDRLEAQCRLGRTLAAAGRVAEAIDVFRARLRRGPCESCQRKLLEKLYFSGKHEDVLVEGEAAVKAQPTTSAYYYLTKSLLALRRHDLALTKALESVRMAPNDARTRDLLGTVYRDRGQIDRALEEFRTAANLKPDDIDYRLSYVRTLTKTGAVAEALKELRTCIEVDPADARGHGWLGTYLGKTPEALTALETAVRIEPRNIVWRFNYGRRLHAMGRYEEAIEQCREGLRIDPEHLDTLDALADALMMQGRHLEAVPIMRETLRLIRDDDNSVAKTYCMLGLALAQSGSFREGLEMARRGHELGSKLPGWDFPSDSIATRCDAFVEHEDQVKAIAVGEAAFPAPPESIVLAPVGVLMGLNLLAARLYEAGIGQISDESTQIASDLDQAARCALLAADGQGPGASNLDEVARGSWRNQARLWLEAAEKRESGIAHSSPDQRDAVARRYRRWLEDLDLASVRDEPRIHALRSDEREAWEAFWARIRAFVAQSDSRPTTRPTVPPAFGAESR